MFKNIEYVSKELKENKRESFTYFLVLQFSKKSHMTFVFMYSKFIIFSQ